MMFKPFFSLLFLVNIFVELCQCAELNSGSFVLTSRNKVRHATLHRYRRQALSTDVSVEGFYVVSTVTSRYSDVLVTSIVRNNVNASRSVSVELRLPKNAFISNFSMVIDSVTYIGEVKGKEAARAQYTMAVAQGQSAGLVTARSRDVQTFDVSVNVAAGRTVNFRLSYVELLVRKLGVYHHRIYINPGQVVEDMRIDVLISEPSGIAEIEARPPSVDKRRRNFDLESIGDEENVVVRRSGTQAFISYTPSVYYQQSLQRSGDLSFVVLYDVTHEEIGGEILIKNGYFVHFFAPTNFPAIPKNIVFVIDRSGSMAGSKIRQTKVALLTILDDLKEDDRFNIITFGSNVRTWKPNQMVNVTPENLDEAKTFVNRITAYGGTNFYGATIEGVSVLETISQNASNTLEEASMLILLTDGRPTSGVTNTERIRSGVRNRVHGRYSIFCLGFGSNLDHRFLEKLAIENKGLSRRIYLDSDAALQLKDFYDEVAAPLLAHVIIKYRGAAIVNTTRTSYDNFFDGSEILVVGQFQSIQFDARSDDLIGIVEARSSEGQVSLTSRANPVEETFDRGFDMEKLWAYLTIKDLLKNQTFATGDDEDVVNEINERILYLSLKYNFVTPLTSMVVTKPDENIVAADGTLRDLIPSPQPWPHPSPQPSGFSGRILGGRGSSTNARVFSSGRSFIFAGLPQRRTTRQPRTTTTTRQPASSHPATSQPRTTTTTSPPTTSPPTTSPPTTSPPATSPPTTSPPATSPPTTSPPTTSQPATSPPATSPPATSPQTTSPPTTSPPATSPPATSPPTTSPPATSPPTTSPPTTSPPATSQPATSPPATSPPATSLPASSPLATSPPTTSPPATSPPTTSPPTTSPPTTSPPATSPPTTSPPTTSPPTTSPPATSPPATSPPATSPPTTSLPATSQPATSPPATSQPATNPPATSQPATSPPATSPPATSQPATSQPGTSQPATTTNQSIGIPVTDRIPPPSNPLALESSCGDNITLQFYQNITSPRFPGLYPSNALCVWRIKLADYISQVGYFGMRLTFLRLDMEEEDSCARDRILIYQDYREDAPSSPPRELCGYKQEGIHYDALSSFVVVFQSDDEVQGRGFLANVQVYPIFWIV